MNTFKLQIDEEALQDIQDATDWYNEQLEGLGTRFQKQVKTQINSLEKNAAFHAVRYKKVRCMLIKKFPFMVHYSLDETLSLVEVFAVIHTRRNPKIWEERSR
jgi:mRNA-degrading endonuclease RelE of RelBE toxin-antitoxin system